MKTVARTPASRAAQATACPWLPALAVTTPAARSASESVAIRLNAPRILNEPVRWRFSAFSHTGRPHSRATVSEEKTGVRRATPSRRRCASWISASVGAVSVAIPHPEYPLHDLTDRREGIELAPLDLAEQPAQLVVLGDGLLEARLGACARDREHLAGEVARAPLRERPGLLEMNAVGVDLAPELLDALAAHRLREDDRRVPVALGVERQDRANLAHHRLR